MTSALTEIRSTRQIAGEPQRRWFSGETLDLVVWLDANAKPDSFQLCYDKPLAEKALTWTPATGFTHQAVDDGSHDLPRHKGTPVLHAIGPADLPRIRQLFGAVAHTLPPDVMALVAHTLASTSVDGPSDRLEPMS